MTAAIKISGPYPDHKTSQSRPYAVSLYEPGRGGEIHRFETEAKAQAFANAQRAAQKAAG